MKKRLALICAAALMLLFTAGVALATPVVDGITLPVNLTVDVGATIPVIATITPVDAGVTVTWTVGNPKYITLTPVDANSCQITGKAPGRVTLYARAGGKSASTIITVNVPQATSIKLNTTAKTLNPSATYQLIATRTPTYNSDQVTWSTGDDTVATVSNDGLVTAVADGSETKSCTITATLVKGGKSATCQITVMKIPEKYVRVTTSAVVPLYASRPLTAVVYPTDAFDRSVKWLVIKNPQVASVDEKGVVTGLKSGTAVIQVSTVNGRSARCTVTVKLVRYASFSASPSSKVLEKTATFQIKIKRSPTYVSYPDMTFTSSDASVATVDATGLMTGVGRGYARITVSGDKGRVTRTITVRVISSSEEIQVTVSAIGDVMLGGDPRKDSYKRFDKLWADHGADYFFARIRSELKGVVFANMEIPLIDTSSIMQGSRSYIFRGRTAYAEALTAGGIDAVDLDNNHIMDYGSRGYSSTKTVALKRWGVGYFGLGSVCYITQKGVRIGFAGFRPENISIAKMKASIQAVQSRCDIVVASFHWGIEGRYSPSGLQVAYGHAAVQAGADLVVGHHSHLVSGIEKYTYKGKTAFIVYGLGTIVSAVERPDDVDTFIYQHTFSVTGTSVTNAGFEIVPVLMTNNGKGNSNDAQPVIATGSDKTRILNKIKQYSPINNPF